MKRTCWALSPVVREGSPRVDTSESLSFSSGFEWFYSVGDLFIRQSEIRLSLWTKKDKMICI